MSHRIHSGAEGREAQRRICPYRDSIRRARQSGVSILNLMASPTRPKAQKSGVPIEELLTRLEAIYGRPRLISRFEPMEELVSCILSQHSSDSSSFPAFTRLRETFPDWEDVVAAGPERLADVIRKAGLANQKARSIIACLSAIKERTGSYSLEHLRHMPMAAARTWLMDLPGVGPKTASIVLCFSFGMDAIPVDTHVYRVCWRVGIIPEEVGETKAHDLLLDVVPKGLSFRFHTTLIQHGRMICKAPLPQCEVCPVTDLCRWFKQGGPAKRRAELQKGRTRPKATTERKRVEGIR
jgi:endonuclease III